MKNFLTTLTIAATLLTAACTKKNDVTATQTPVNDQNGSSKRKITNGVGTTYYVDPAGLDTNNGTSPSTPWQTLSKLNSTTFSPGDQILFKCGGTWSGELHPLGSGNSTSPIIINKYGSGSNPIISGSGTTSLRGILLYNQSYWEINNLEIANYIASGSSFARGILVQNTSTTTAVNHILINNCYVHDVNCTYSTVSGIKSTGGIILYGYFNDAKVKNCYIKDCAIEGLRTTPYASGAPLSTSVVFTGNKVENVFGDGIVLNTVDHGKIDSNIVHNACMSDAADFAGCWTYNSIGTIVSHNEVYGLVGGMDDGEAFDADVDTDGDIYEYNYSHDNNKGFMLFMPNATNIIVRYNISANDVLGGTKLIDFKPTVTTNNIYNNVFYVTNNITNVFEHAFHGNFKNNILNATGTVTNFSETAMNSGSVFAYNCMYPTSALTTNWNTSSHTANVFSSPVFVAPTTYSIGLSSAAAFRLGSTSPCKTAGTVITDNGNVDFFGTLLSGSTNPDIGAIKY